jgi:DNA mismatch repair protein MutL
MSKIRILPEILSNKIAAGEVVERPASVVKELVENAVDAGSTRIIIEVEKGGRSLIRVADNGCGMGHDDALLALERYATSKLYNDQDLYNIRTLGFRGEALPSIAAVSKFTLVTRDEESAAGTEIRVAGGKIRNVSEVGAPRGTMITAAQLFYNTPARRKFLKTINTEMGHIADTVSNIALGQPDVQFKLLHNSKEIKSWTVVSDPFDRATDVLGHDMSARLHPIEWGSDNFTISGWICSPRFTRKTARGIYIFVNGRFVRDKIIQHALFEGYAQRLMKGQFPVAVLFIQVPFDQLDINVHPAKQEVRFSEHYKVHDTVKRIVTETLYHVDRPEWAPTKPPGEETYSEQPQVAEDLSSTYRVQRSKSKVQDLQRAFEHRTWHLAPGTVSRQSPIWSKNGFGDSRIVGQIHNTYIVCESDDGLILVDQHAAHERVLYEQLKHRSKTLGRVAQKLLVPETIELGYREADILEKLIPKFNEFGLEIEPFGGNTFVVKAIPALLADREIKPLIIEIVDKTAAVGFSAGFEESVDESLKIMACHGAIRANQVLSGEQIKGLLDQLDKCNNSSHCPHGRPTWIQWTIKSLEKSFNRII